MRKQEPEAQGLLQQPECDSYRDADGREEGMGASVVAGGNATPIFETPKSILDAVPLAIQCLIVRQRHRPLR